MYERFFPLAIVTVIPKTDLNEKKYNRFFSPAIITDNTTKNRPKYKGTKIH